MSLGKLMLLADDGLLPAAVVATVRPLTAARWAVAAAPTREEEVDEEEEEEEERLRMWFCGISLALAFGGLSIIGLNS